MKKIALLLVLALLVSTLSVSAAFADGSFSESPLLTPLVESGELPPVEERMPKEPKLVHEILEEYLEPEVGNYGGTIHSNTPMVNTDLSVFVGLNEALLSCTSVNSGEIIGNILKGYDTNEDCTEFTLYLREGLKWSDGEPVTMEDFIFTIDSVLNNPVLTPEFPSKLRAGGSTEGAPFTYEVVDDWTLKVNFESSYGGFLVTISIAGWVGYTDLLKPAHYLKPFHIDYAEECHGSLEAFYDYIRPFAEVIGYDDPEAEGVWSYVFNQIDMINGENTNPMAALTSQFFSGLIDKDFPVLYPFVMESSTNNVMKWVRNPYYYKVDEAGQQLPYADYIESVYCETPEISNLMLMSGDVDYTQADLSEYPTLRENEENGGYTVHLSTYHNTPTDILININYGLNADGTVKDDANSQAWQEVVNDIRFRQALCISIDAEEIIDTLYYGFAEKSKYYTCEHDIDGANALLDEMGMVDVNGDGYRETPSGAEFTWQIWNANDANDIIPMCELLVEYWGEIGLHATVYTTDGALLSTSREANEIPMRVFWVHETQLWHYFDWGDYYTSPLWEMWYNAGGMRQELDADKYLEPSEGYKEFRQLLESMKTSDPETAANVIMPEVAQKVADDCLLIVPLTNVGRLMVVNNDIGNVPTGGLAFSWNMNFEQIFFRSFEYED